MLHGRKTMLARDDVFDRLEPRRPMAAPAPWVDGHAVKAAADLSAVEAWTKQQPDDEQHQARGDRNRSTFGDDPDQSGGDVLDRRLSPVGGRRHRPRGPASPIYPGRTRSYSP